MCFLLDTVDGCEILHQLIGGYPSIDRVLTILLVVQVYGRMDLSKKSELLKSSRIAPLYLGFCWYVCVCVYIITYVCIYIYRDKTLYSIYKLMDLENPKGCDQLPVPNDLEMMLMTGVIPKIAQHGLCDLCVFHLISGSIATCSTYLYTASGIFG